jgi:hypothetical protein
MPFFSLNDAEKHEQESSDARDSWMYESPGRFHTENRFQPPLSPLEITFPLFFTETWMHQVRSARAIHDILVEGVIPTPFTRETYANILAFTELVLQEKGASDWAKRDARRMHNNAIRAVFGKLRTTQSLVHQLTTLEQGLEQPPVVPWYEYEDPNPACRVFGMVMAMVILLILGAAVALHILSCAGIIKFRR